MKRRGGRPTEQHLGVEMDLGGSRLLDLFNVTTYEVGNHQYFIIVAQKNN